MELIRFSFFLSISLTVAWAAEKEMVPFWEEQESGVTSGMRGVSAVSEDVAWASGTFGTVIKTVDGGATWEKCNPPGGLTDLDYRDIHAFSDTTAIVMGIASPAMFWKTTDGCKGWTRVHFSDANGTFYNAMDFWDDMNGIAFGDAIDGRLLILRTSDGGDTWQELPFDQRPEVAEGQYAFAASGTCLRVTGDSMVSIGLGSTESTFLNSNDRGETWTSVATPIQHGTPSAGIFSIDFVNSLEGFIVGGDYRGDNETTEANAARTTDGGITWNLIQDNRNPGGYRSVVAYMGSDLVLTCSKTGCDYSVYESEGFIPMNGAYYSVSVSRDATAAYASGQDGKVGKLTFF